MNFEQLESEIWEHSGLPAHVVCDDGTELTSARAHKVSANEAMTLDRQAQRLLHKPTVERFFQSMNENLSRLPCDHKVTTRK